MAIETPKIDKRNFGDIVKQIQGLCDFYTPEWKNTDSDDPGVVMTNLFARLMEIIIERLNKVPDKNFVYFLDMLGIERLPGNTARAPLTFTLPEGSISGGLVPVRTQVATVQTEEAEAIIFETEKNMYATPVKLQKVFSINPLKDIYEDFTQIATGMKSGSFKLFLNDSSSNSLNEHILYIAHDELFAFTEQVTLILTFTMKENLLIENWDLEWERFIKKEDKYLPETIKPDEGNKNLLLKNSTITFKDFIGTEKTTQGRKEEGGGEAHWISCKLTKPIPARNNKLPEIDTAKASIHIKQDSLYPDLLFFNNVEIDYKNTGLDFYPFGESPKLNDRLCIGSKKTLSKQNAKIVINLVLKPGISPDPSKLEIKWEYWNGTKWYEIPNIKGYNKDDTENIDVLKLLVPEGKIKFDCPDIKEREINGKLNYWIRARISAGDYGSPASYTSGGVYVASTLNPPSIALLELNYELQIPEEKIQKCLTYNDFAFTNRITEARTDDTIFHPFTWVEDTEPSFYLGFDNSFGDQPISIFFAVVEKLSASGNANGDSTAGNSSEHGPAIVVWEYFSQSGEWARLEVEDDTMNFTILGTITFIGPSDFARTSKFGFDLFWLRARLESGDYDTLPQLKGIYLNTTWASNIVTIKDEVIGSSNGEKNQSFRFSHAPVLNGEIIYVKELELPSEREKKYIEQEEKRRLRQEEEREITKKDKDNLIKIIENKLSGEEEIWVRWHKVGNFLNSTSSSRHYVIDRVEGKISFGDDIRGKIPSIMKDGIKAEFYQAGGGAKANKVAVKNSIKELKSSLPYIDKVYNIQAAAGGSDAETMEETKERGPQTIKHGNRAITIEDFVWLAKQASTRIALAKCLPTTNSKLEFEPGSVTVIIVPESDEPKPLPSQELTYQVQKYLSERGLSTVVRQIYVLGPGFTEVSVSAEVVPKNRDQASIIEGRIVNNLKMFLHPLKGGPDGKGWDFGRSAFISEIYAVIESTDDVDYVKSVILNNDPLLNEVSVNKNSLVFSGTHDIQMI